jgi:hypothetical protein
MDFDLQNLILLLPITGPTINGVMLSPAFRVLIYTLIAVTLCFATIFFRARNSFPLALRKAFVVAFFLSGLIYAVQGDIVWTSWLITDTKAYAGLTTEEKLSRLEGRFYEFILAARKVIPGDYMLFSSDGHLARRAEYLLLPLRKREQADYIIVLEDKESDYYVASRSFIRGSLKIDRVEPIYFSTPEAYILRRMP